MATRARRERGRVYRRRRRRVFGGLALLGFLPGLIVGASSGGGGEAPATAALPPECAGAGPDGLRRLAGQKVMVPISERATPALRRRAGRGEIGGVIVFPPLEADERRLRSSLATLQDAAETAGNPPLLVAIDQEGGPVKRLPLAPPARGPAEIAGAGQARLEGKATASSLAELGINIDLAPVLDVGRTGSAIADRAFGSEVRPVARRGVAFAEGLAQGGVAATAKHFPGLGRATVSTDVAATTVDASRDELRSDLEPFRSAIEAGVEVVMVSSAIYPGYDRGEPAFASPRIADRLLRDELGFQGVSITDDLDAPAVSAEFSAPEAGVAATAAGMDVLLFAQSDARGVTKALAEAARRGRLDTEALRNSCARMVALKQEVAPAGG